MKKVPQTLFGKQIRSNKKAHELMIALNMVGLNVDIPVCRLILKAQEAFSKMGVKFDLQTASKIQIENDDYFAKIEDDFKSEQKIVSK
jgi:hypothetical protein